MKKSLLVAGMVAMMSVGVAMGAGPAKAKPKEIALTPASEVKWMPMDPKAGDKGPQMSVVFGDVKKKGPVGVLMKFPAGAKPGPHIHSSDYWAVVLTGTEHDFASGAEEGKALPPGSYWFQPGKQGHDNHCEDGADCTIFIYMPNGFDMSPDKGPAAAAKKK